MMKAWCSSAKRRRKRQCSAPSAAEARPRVSLTRGLCAAVRWSTIITSMLWIGISDRSSSRSAAISLSMPSCACAKRQLAQEGIAFEALDNGILSCANPKRLQAICDGLSAAKIDALLRKWLRVLPHPFTGADRKAGYRYAISILQGEFSTTQVLDRPVHGRLFFEQVIRENLDLGRPEQVQLIFNRRILRNTRARFRTRVVTQDVTPSLNVYYKNARIKQYHKENRALRTETTINNTYDFGVGRRLHNLPKLRAIGFGQP